MTFRLRLGIGLGVVTLVCLLRFFSLVPFVDASDSRFHVRFAQDFFRNLSEKKGFPDWDARPYGGRGTPAFRFYAPAAYVSTAGFMALGASVETGLKLTLFLYALVGCWGICRCLTALGRPEWGLGAAFFFLSSPIVAIHLFQMFLMQNLLAILVLPVVLDGWIRWTKSREGLVQTISGMALIGLTHLPACLMAGLGLGLVGVVQSFGKKTLAPLVHVCGVLLIAGCLMAPYAFPAVWDMKEVHFDRLKYVSPLDRQDFLNDFEMAWGPDSGSELIWTTFRLEFQVMLIFFALLGVLGFFLLPEDQETQIVKVFSCVGFFFLFLTLRFSCPLWMLFPPFSYLQFPWRFLFPAFVFLCPAMVLALLTPQKETWRKAVRWGGILVWGASLLMSGTIQGLGQTIQDMPETMNIRQFYPYEYLPVTCLTEHSPEAGKVRELRFLAGEGRVDEENHTFERSEWGVTILTLAARVLIITHYDPLWRLSLDGKEVPLQAGGRCALMTAHIPGGAHRLLLSRVNPPSRSIGIGLFGLGVILLMLWKWTLWKERKSHSESLVMGVS